jgi:DNA-binding transcriptional ArsR family regulator
VAKSHGFLKSLLGQNYTFAPDISKYGNMYAVVYKDQNNIAYIENLKVAAGIYINHSNLCPYSQLRTRRKHAYEQYRITTDLRPAPVELISPLLDVEFAGDTQLPNAFNLHAFFSDCSFTVLEHIQLTFEARAQRYPSYSPDGEWIVYASNADGGLYFDLWLMDSNDSFRTQLTNDACDQLAPKFSPDGTKIVYYAKEDGGLFDKFGAGNGTVAYHLRKLEQQGLILSRREGISRCIIRGETEVTKKPIKRRERKIKKKKPPERKETLEPDWDVLRGSFKVSKKEPEEFIE